MFPPAQTVRCPQKIAGKPQPLEQGYTVCRACGIPCLKKEYSRQKPRQGYFSFPLKSRFVVSKDSESFIITDAVLNQFPTLEQRLNIAINAYDFASSYNTENKKLSIGFLNHSGHFNIKNKTACESELLSEAFNQYKPFVIAQTGQLDILLSKDSRRIKGIPDYGSANIIVVNDINEGNSLVKAYMLNGWNCMGYVVGADIPIILNSRSNLNVEKSVNFLVDNGIIQ